MSDRTCAQCEFFDRDSDDDGSCRRYPPVPVVADGEDVTTFPLVPNDWWCGEFRPRVH